MGPKLPTLLSFHVLLVSRSPTGLVRPPRLLALPRDALLRHQTVDTTVFGALRVKMDSTLCDAARSVIRLTSRGLAQCNFGALLCKFRDGKSFSSEIDEKEAILQLSCTPPLSIVCVTAHSF